MSPGDIVRAVVLSKMAAPHCFAVLTDRYELSVAEPGVNLLPVAHGAGCGKVPFLVTFGQLSFRRDLVLPDELPCCAVESANGEFDLLVRGSWTAPPEWKFPSGGRIRTSHQ